MALFSFFMEGGRSAEEEGRRGEAMGRQGRLSGHVFLHECLNMLCALLCGVFISECLYNFFIFCEHFFSLRVGEEFEEFFC